MFRLRLQIMDFRYTSNVVAMTEITQEHQQLLKTKLTLSVMRVQPSCYLRKSHSPNP